jgi:galactose mutarotase-like enzyme
MSVKVDLNWTYQDIRTVILENDLLRVVIMPDLGAKIWQITYKPRGKDLLWQNPRLSPRKLPFHANYDDQFFGGWDELYPNDERETINGEAYPDHGEIWTLPWQSSVENTEKGEVTVHLWVETPISCSRIDKWITLREGESKLRFRHTITNNGAVPQPFLWKLHAAVAVDEHSRIDLPASHVYLERFGRTRIGKNGVSYTWPFVEDEQGKRHDMREVLPADSGVGEFQYATDMKAGWCAVTHTQDRIGFGLAYDAEVFPSCWLFATYGGWRNLNTVVLEPCTGYPVSVNQGLEQGTHRILQSGETIRCEVIATVFEGLDSVESIDTDGNVKG